MPYLQKKKKKELEPTFVKNHTNKKSKGKYLKKKNYKSGITYTAKLSSKVREK